MQSKSNMSQNKINTYSPYRHGSMARVYPRPRLQPSSLIFTDYSQLIDESMSFAMGSSLLIKWKSSIS